MKTQIAIGSTLHPGGLSQYLAATPENRRPHYYIHRDGTVTQLLPPDADTRYIPHTSRAANRRAIAVALEGGGPLVRTPEGFTYPDEPGHTFVPYEYCERSPHNGHRLYECHPDRQLRALQNLIEQLKPALAQPLRYSNQLSVHTPAAAAGTPAVWLRLSYSPRNHDPHPQPGLLQAVKQATAL